MKARSVEDVYGEYPISEEETAAILDASLNPRSPDALFDRLAELGVSPAHRVLDVGCRDAGHTLVLTRRFGCRIIGVDPVEKNILDARRNVAEAGLTDRVEVRIGGIHDLGEPDSSIDLVWCRDVLVHVPDLAAGLRECARVLVPGGSMLIYQTFATDLLEPKEAAWLYAALAIVPENMDESHLTACAEAAGLSVAERDPIGSEWRERWEEDGRTPRGSEPVVSRTSQQLLRIARMTRDKARLVGLLGERLYEVELADCRWGVYQMLGKLRPVVYRLVKPALP